MEKAKDTKAKEAAKEKAAKEKQSHIHSTKEINAHNDNKKVTLCMKYNAGECRRGDGCPYFHACSARLQNGRPCMQGHAAKDHRGST